jgi:hypothetical protein
VAGAAEAIRARKDPGEWTGAKGRRVLTAAISAGGVDGLIDRDPNKHEGRHVVESVLAGLATNHLVNGSRSKSRSGRGSRGRSQSRGGGGGGGIKSIASAGILAAAGKQIYDRVRSKSRGRDRSSSRSSRDSDRDSRSRGGGDDSKKRSSSVSRYLNKGLAALGLEDKAENGDGGRRQRGSRYSDEWSDDDDDYRSSGRRRRDVRGSQVGSSRADNSNSMAGESRSRAVSANSHGGGGGNGDGSDHGSSHSSSNSDSDLGDSDEDKRERRGMVRREMLTAGLATVASVHAAHSVMKGIEARKKRRQELREGKITPEEARKRRMKADLMDAASVGLAALGIKGAIGEWKEVHEKYREHQDFAKKCQERHVKRIQRATRSQSVSNGSGTGTGSGSGSRRALTDAPRYKDGNPYGDYRDYRDYPSE